MDAYDPTKTDDTKSAEERLEQDRRLSEQGLRPSELSDEEKDDLTDDFRSDRLTNKEQDSDDDLSDVVPPEEVDGND